MYDHILLPTDGSEATTDVVDHAIELADHHDATLHALYVINTTSLTDLPSDSSWEGIGEALRKEGKHALDTVEDRAGDIDLEREMVDGSPSKEIVAYAEDSGCDVVVMGTHARSGVDRLLLGSVAERVVRTSTVPVLTIRVSAGGDSDE
jgi:nucleotide-binding universal stress UspA family protein